MQKNSPLIFAFLPLIVMGVSSNRLWAAPFQNLDFEQATIQSASSSQIPWDAAFPISASAAIPSWTVTEDTTVCNTVWGLPAALDETAVSLISTISFVLPPGRTVPPPESPIQGNFSVQLYSYIDAPADFYHTASISQTGDLPADAKTILFYIRAPYDGGRVANIPLVSLNGTIINVLPLSTSAGVTLMAGDISTYGGTTSNLTFTAAGVHGSFPTNEDIYDLDNISFSPLTFAQLSVPEPATAAILFIPAVAFLLNRRKPK